MKYCSLEEAFGGPKNEDERFGINYPESPKHDSNNLGCDDYYFHILNCYECKSRLEHLFNKYKDDNKKQIVEHFTGFSINDFFKTSDITIFIIPIIIFTFILSYKFK